MTKRQERNVKGIESDKQEIKLATDDMTVQEIPENQQKSGSKLA